MKKFISGILFIMVVISCVGLITIFSAGKFISEETLKNTVEKIDIPKALLNNNANSKNETNTNKIVDELDKVVLADIYEIAAKGNVSKEKVDNVINSNAVKDFAAIYISKVANYITTGEENKITGKEITGVVKDNINSVATEAGINLDNNSKNAIISVVDTYSNDIATLIPSPKVLVSEKDKEVTNTVQVIFSNKTKYTLLTILGISSVLLILIQLKKYNWMKWLSLATMCSGSIVCLLAFISVSVINNFLQNESQFILNIANTFADELKMTLLIRGGIVIGISLVVLLIYEAIHRNIVSKELDQMASDIEEEFKDK